jgi:hypothetical protein
MLTSDVRFAARRATSGFCAGLMDPSPALRDSAAAKAMADMQGHYAGFCAMQVIRGSFALAAGFRRRGYGGHGRMPVRKTGPFDFAQGDRTSVV